MLPTSRFFSITARSSFSVISGPPARAQQSFQTVNPQPSRQREQPKARLFSVTVPCPQRGQGIFRSFWPFLPF